MVSSSYQSIINISNDLSKLIPIGTINITNLPKNVNNFGIDADDGWSWFDINFLIESCNSINPYVYDLQFLINFRYITATYSVIKHTPSISLAKIRLYAIPFDIQGSRYFHEWRGSRPKHYNLEGRFKKVWTHLIEYIDFSSFGWNHLNINSGLTLLSLTQIDSSSIPIQSPANTNFHIDRWCSAKSTSPPPVNFDASSQSLGAKIQDIYAGVNSPDISKYYDKSSVKLNNKVIPTAEEVIINLIHNLLENETTIPGVKTSLYPFQIKSLCKMYEKESIRDQALMPNLVKIRSPKGSCYYYDLLKGGIYLEPDTFHQPRGGILAENMGLGKTLICLSLICLTKWEISQLPPDYLIYSPPDEDDLIEVDGDGSYLLPNSSKSGSPLKNLTQICRDCISQKSLPWKYYAQDLPDSVINFLNTSPGFFRIPLDNSEYISPFRIQKGRRSERKRTIEDDLPDEGRIFKTLYYCNTTLIVVPDNLFHQWNNELKKHIEDGYLKKLFISSQFKKPIKTNNAEFVNEVNDDPTYLINYDLIIISLSILSRQIDKKDDNVMLKIFWKRLIIDEGHSMNSKSSKSGTLCRDMHAERRWAVTGTPTSGLTRLYMDEEEEEDTLVKASPKKKNRYVVKNSFNERDDLVKLGNIVTNFLKIEPFHSQPKLWNSSMIRPLSNDTYGSSTSLSNLLNSIVVRHALDEVERDIKLPNLHHTSVLIKPSFHNKLAINIFTAVLAVNAVSSERKDIDYMFHPANRQQLRRLITNLQRATFHWSGFKQEDVESLIHVCKVSLDKRKPDGSLVYSDFDVKLLKDSMEMAELALNNPRWRIISLLHEMNYFVSDIPQVFTKAFGTGVLNSSDNQDSCTDVGVFGAPHINALQEFFYKNRFMDMNDEGKLTEKLETLTKPFWSKYWNDTMKKNSQRFNKQDQEDDFSADVVQGRVINAVDGPEKKKSQRNGHVRRNSQDQESISRLGRDDGDGLKVTNEINTMSSMIDNDISFKSLKNALILGTASAKLSYLASKILENQLNKVKSIVFFEFEDSAYYLTELLDILGANYILYATFINPSQRATNLSEFSDFPSEKDGGITLIMDLRLAAHGLTIISATKVYFISPVWHRSVEAQAIKRSHRIGQTNEVEVETLVMEGTLEEEIYRRRTMQGNDDDNYHDADNDDSKQKYVIDDTGMQDFILKHKFLPINSLEKEYAPIHSTTTMPRTLVDEDINSDETSLNHHQDKLTKTSNGHLTRDWETFIFNSDNLAKLNVLKNQKITRDVMKDQFIKTFVETAEDSQREKELLINKKKSQDNNSNGPPRKKVRF